MLSSIAQIRWYNEEIWLKSNIIIDFVCRLSSTSKIGIFHVQKFKDLNVSASCEDIAASSLAI